MSEPQEMPADALQEPAGRKKTCKECSGSGKKPSRFLGTPDDPCPVCAGRGLIEVVEEPLTPWQQEVIERLTRIERLFSARWEASGYSVTIYPEEKG